MQVSFGSFIPTRVMLTDEKALQEVTGTEAADDVMALLCGYLRNDKDSPNTPSIERQRRAFENNVPGYCYPTQIYNAKKTPEQNITTLVVEDENNSAIKTKYVLTGADARYKDDMGSLLRRRSEPWLYIKGSEMPEGAGQLKAKAAIERQKSLRAMVKEHAFPKALIVHAKCTPNGNTKEERYEIQNIEFVKNENSGLDFRA